MVQITYIENNGLVKKVEAPSGESLMRAAVDNAVAGIDAVCGGVCSCATCHVYVDAAWLDKLRPADETESEMLDCAENRRPESRLACQITLDDTLSGIVVRIAGSPG